MSRAQYDPTFNLGDHIELIRSLYGEETLQELRDGTLDSETIEAIKDEVLDRYEDESTELNGVCVVYSKADRILTRNSNVSVVLHTPTYEEAHFEGIAGWSDGKTVTLNRKVITLLAESDIPALNGLNYHELSHLLYTPRGGSEFITWVQKNEYGVAMNYLEDARIETLLTARFPSTRLFLEANFMRYVACTDTNSAPLFLLSRGRKYIPLVIRQKIADLFVQEKGLSMATEVADIIDNYRTLVLPRDSEIAKPLIERFAKIVGTGNMSNKMVGDGEVGADGISCPNDCENRAPMKFGRPLGVKDQEADSKVAKGNGISEELRESANADDVLDGGNNEGSPSSVDNDNVSDEFLDQDTRNIDKGLADLIEQRAKELKNNADVQREVREFREAVGSNDEHRNNVKPARYINMSPAEIEKYTMRNADYPLIADQFGRELERLEIDNEPAWDREKASGRLNIQRTMNAGLNDIDRMFDQWSEVDYSTEIEAVILLDNSGSMGGRIQSACASVWAIKRGLERINANSTVFSFNSGSRVLYSSEENTVFDTVRVLHSGGTTNPLRALNEAKQIFNLTTRTTKLLFIITDGGFDNAQPCDDLIKQFNEEGVITSTVFIGWFNNDEISDERIEGYRHYTQNFNVISNPSDIVKVATDIVIGQLGVYQ